MKGIASDVAMPYLASGHAISLADFYERMKAMIEGIPHDVQRLIQRDDRPSLIAFFRGQGAG